MIPSPDAPSPTSGGACCDEYAALSRRGFLRASLAVAGTTTVLGSAVVSASPASAARAASMLVVLSLRGAADGLSLVVPHADPTYYAARPSIAVPAERLLVPDEMFGLHPNLAPLLPLWQAGRLAAVHATGLPAPNRSHFAAMEEIEDADPGSSVRRGWLNRLLGTDATQHPLQGFHLGAGVVPSSLFGPEPVMASGSVEAVAIPGDDEGDTSRSRVTSLHTLWDADTSTLARGMRSAFDAVADFAPAREVPSHEADYPDTDLGRGLSEAARILKADVGVQVVTVDQGDWDMHSDLGNLAGGRMRRNADDLARSMAAFFDDLGTVASRVTLVALSEFGRRVQENANQGLDHGHGNVMFVAGAGVRGGRYLGRWPGLSDDLDADLPVTTDYRSVLAEVVSSRFGASTAAVFPGFSAEHVGVMGG